MSSSPRSHILASLARSGIAAPLLAAPADQVRTRVEGLRKLGAAFKAVNDGLRSSQPQTALFHTSAGQIRDASQAMYNWFPAGSGPQRGVKTAAKPEIWTQAARFRQAQDAFAAQAAGFQAAVDGGNVVVPSELRHVVWARPARTATNNSACPRTKGRRVGWLSAPLPTIVLPVADIFRAG
jgi:cytochrome c556